MPITHRRPAAGGRAVATQLLMLEAAVISVAAYVTWRDFPDRPYVRNIALAVTATAPSFVILQGFFILAYKRPFQLTMGRPAWVVPGADLWANLTYVALVALTFWALLRRYVSI